MLNLVQKKFFSLYYFFCLAAGLVLGFNAHGEEKKPPSLLGDKNCIESGDCKLNDIWNVIIGGAQILLALSGTLALAVFIYGGFIFLFSGGDKDKVAKGKGALVNATIGLIIVFASYVIIGFVLKSFGYKGLTSWFQIPS